MTEHRIHRWFQFGVLDVLMLMMFAAIAAILYRPAESRSMKALPWVFGIWQGSVPYRLVLLPEGYYEYHASPDHSFRGGGWSLSRHGDLPDAFVLTCDEHRFILRSDWLSGTMDLLDEDGTVKSRLNQLLRLEGSMRFGVPHGTWTSVIVQPSYYKTLSLSYRRGELVEVHENGVSGLDFLNRVRSIFSPGTGDWNDATPEDTPP